VSDRATRSRSFDSVAADYERHRPEYPEEALRWAAAQLELGSGARVLDVGAGTGKLTRGLVSLGFDVVAIEPGAPMLAQLRATVPEAEAHEAPAESIPLPDASADAVTVAQAFHWFDGPAALAEIHRVLRPGGALALVWNRRPLEDPVHAAIERIIAPYRGDAPAHRSGAWRAAFDATTLFGPLEERTFAHSRPHDADALADRVGSTSFVAALDDGPQADVIAAVRALAAEGPVELPYVCEVLVCDRRP
jgi:ubiquinone/menaquinone biosynthesis C-methylase UbiE